MLFKTILFPTDPIHGITEVLQIITEFREKHAIRVYMSTLITRCNTIYHQKAAMFYVTALLTSQIILNMQFVNVYERACNNMTVGVIAYSNIFQSKDVATYDSCMLLEFSLLWGENSMQV